MVLDFAEEIAFLTKGSVRMFHRVGLDDVMIGYSTSGDFFGDFEFYKRSPRLCRYQSAQSGKFFTIDYSRFLDAMEDNDRARTKFVKFLKRRYDQFLEVKRSLLVPGYMDEEVLQDQARSKSSLVNVGMASIAAIAKNESRTALT